MKILVTGAAGLLGREVAALARSRGHDVHGTTRDTLDVTDPAAASAVLADARPDAVVHCAAYTAVDRAEEEPELAMRVNRDGTAHVAAAAAERGARFVTVSTDYVFDGRAAAAPEGASDREADLPSRGRPPRGPAAEPLRRTPYLPDDTPRPLSVYGRSKLEGERAALDSAWGALVVRTSWLYGAGGRNFVSAMLERGRAGEPLRVVDDQRARPTWAKHAAAGILDLLDRRVRGIWHVADGGEATWLELAREAFRLRGVETPLEAVSTEEWGAPAPRPKYSVLDLAGTEVLLGRPMMDWRESLARFLEGTEGGTTS